MPKRLTKKKLEKVMLPNLSGVDFKDALRALLKTPPPPVSNGKKCSLDKHDWKFSDSFPNHEIYECVICKYKKFVDTKTGKETYE